MTEGDLTADQIRVSDFLEHDPGFLHIYGPNNLREVQ